MTEPYRFGLVGDNVGYSKSSEIFQAIFKHLDADGSFEVFNFSSEQFAKEFPKLTASGVQGLSITIPYKNKVIAFLDDLDPIARALQAVNSIHLDGGHCCGFNTDCYGFSLPLRSHAERLKKGAALILGAGGGARAVVYALHTDYEIGCCTVMARDGTRLKSFKQGLVKQLPNLRISTRQMGRSKRPGRVTWDIVVNCTPIGGWNHPTDSPLPEWFDWSSVRLYYDLNYNADNNLVACARRSGVEFIDGSAMLVAQALQSFYIWTGLKVSFEPIYAEVFGG